MGWLHWLILVPYYIFAAVTLFLGALLLTRLLRRNVRANALAGFAVAGGILAVAAPLAAGLCTIDDYRVLPMLVLVAASFLLAGLDAALEPVLPTAADKELAQT